MSFQPVLCARQVSICLENSRYNSPRSFKPSTAISEDSAEAYEGRLLSVVQNILGRPDVVILRREVQSARSLAKK